MPSKSLALGLAQKQLKAGSVSQPTHVQASGDAGLGQSLRAPVTPNASPQVTVEEDSYLAHPTRDRAKIQHSRRPPTRGHLMAVVCKTLRQ